MNFIKFLVFIVLFKLVVSTGFAGNKLNCKDSLSNLIQSPYLQNTWGIELELKHNNKYSRKDVALKIQDYLNSLGHKTKFSTIDINRRGIPEKEIPKDMPKSPYNDYLIEYELNGRNYVWTVPFEPDFYNANRGINYPGVEITSPIMRDEKDHFTFEKIVNFLNKIGLEVAFNKGGTHIHWGIGKLKIKDITRIYEAYYKSFPEIKKIFNPDPDRGYISFEDLENTLFKLRDIKNKNLSLEDLENPYEVFRNGPIRYNIRIKTFESRFFNSSKNPKEILFFTMFSRAFFLKVLEDDSFYTSLHKLSADEILVQLGLDIKSVTKRVSK